MPKPSAVSSAARPIEPVPFSEFIAQIEDGDLERDLSAAHRDIVARLHRLHQQNGGKPTTKMILTLEFVLIDGLMNVEPSFRLDPIPRRPVSRFFPTPEGALSPNPLPVQDDLPLQSRKKGVA